MSLTQHISAQLCDYGRLMRLDKPIGTYLLLWPTLWALWVAAEGFPKPQLLIIFVLGVFFMRTAGCIINDLTDRNIDGQVARTHDRPLATGQVSVLEALVLTLLLLSLCLYLVLQTNLLTISLAVVALVIATLYPLMKRYTYLPQVALGAAFSMGIPMAFAAQTGEVPAIAWLIFSANLIWTVAYDTLYAMVDREYDLTIGVKSSAIFFGDYDRVAVGLLQLLTLLAFIALGARLQLSAWYYGSLALVFALFVYHLWLIRERDTQACFKAFLHNHWVGMAVFIGLLLHYGYQS